VILQKKIKLRFHVPPLAAFVPSHPSLRRSQSQRDSTRYELNLPPPRSSSAPASTEQLPKAARPPPTSFLLLVVSRRSHSDELYSRRLPILALPLSNPDGLFKHPLFRSKRREESENVDGGKKGEKEGNEPRLYGGGIRSENSERKQSKVSLRVGGRGRGREEERKKERASSILARTPSRSSSNPSSETMVRIAERVSRESGRTRWLTCK